LTTEHLIKIVQFSVDIPNATIELVIKWIEEYIYECISNRKRYKTNRKFAHR